MEARQGKKEMTGRHYETVARWIKEIALLVLAALVIQNIVAGSALTNPHVLIGGAVSLLGYVLAIRFLLKS